MSTDTLGCGYFAPCEQDADHDGPHTAGMYPEWQVPTIEPMAFIHPARFEQDEAVPQPRTAAGRQLAHDFPSVGFLDAILEIEAQACPEPDEGGAA